MKINGKTKISTLIKHNVAAIEVIAAINSHFNKLRNPILRAVLAPRVSVEDASRIGKCEVDLMLKKLYEIGFELDVEVSKVEIGKEDNRDVLKIIQSGKIISLDVRPILSGGEDPFLKIMEVLKQVPDGFVLEVINTFEPTPLIKIIEKKGYISHIESKGEIVKTYFTKIMETLEMIEECNTDFICSNAEFENEREKIKGHCSEIDVRDLEMPLPMITILDEMEELVEGQSLLVHHKKVPQYLIPELVERQFQVWITEIEEGYVKLLIHK